MSLDHRELGETPEAPSTILLVEDDRVSLKFMEAMLRDAGYRVHRAGDGRLCLQKVTQLHPDLIIMDVIMPNMDGLEACRRLKADEVCRRIPVIFVTGNTDEQTLQAAFDAGGNDYVRKPVNRVELLARVRTALIQSRMIRKLAEEEKLKGVLETAGGICHEFNQPLQYVLGVVQLLMMDIPTEDAVHAHLDAIRLRIEQMGEITRKLSAITRFRTRKYAGDLNILDIGKSTVD
ncbi:MAG: response regulator [Desulfobacteraceae bacterium]|nr:MAG: response regulator [Desulfobacteraceae bacterium]